MKAGVQENTLYLQFVSTFRRRVMRGHACAPASILMDVLEGEENRFKLLYNLLRIPIIAFDGLIFFFPLPPDSQKSLPFLTMGVGWRRRRNRTFALN